MIECTLKQLRLLKLSGMASALQTQLEQPGTYEGLAFAERLQLLVDYPLRQNSCRLKFLKKIKFEIRDENIYKIFRRL